jgi:hypothetical protein
VESLISLMGFLVVAIILGLTVLMCLQESKRRKISFLSALLICILLTPLIGYFIVSNKPLRMTRGCKWCGNQQNESEYCGICNKNESGELKP